MTRIAATGKRVPSSPVNSARVVETSGARLGTARWTSTGSLDGIPQALVDRPDIGYFVIDSHDAVLRDGQRFAVLGNLFGVD